HGVWSRRGGAGGASSAQGRRLPVSHRQDRGLVGPIQEVLDGDRNTAARNSALGHSRRLPGHGQDLGRGGGVLPVGRRKASHRGGVGEGGPRNRRKAIFLGE